MTFSQASIGRRLFVAFLMIAVLSIAPGVFAWLILRGVSQSQTILSAQALPAVVSAQSLSEASDRLVAIGPAMRRADTQAAFDQQRSEFARLRAEIDRLGKDVSTPLPGPDNAQLLRIQARSLVSDLTEQESLVAEQLPLYRRFDQDVVKVMDAATELTELAETFVSNALAQNLAVIADLYKPTSRNTPDERRLDMLDQLVERDMANLQRMNELRLASSKIGLVANKFRYARNAKELFDIKAEYISQIDTITRRVKDIADPTRLQQARAYLSTLSEAVRDETPGGGLVGARSRLNVIARQSDALAQTALVSSDEARAIAARLLKQAHAFSEHAAKQGQTAVTWGLVVLIASLLLAIAGSILVVWLLVERRLASPLEKITIAFGELSEGDTEIDVNVDGPPEIRRLGRAFRVFRDETKRRKLLEIEREQSNAELRQHRHHLQALVQEQTAMLQSANGRLTTEAHEHALARRRAEEANRAKTDFLAVMSHEIRTPMTGMIGMMDLLSSSGLETSQAKWLDGAQRSSAALLRVLDSVLGYAKAEAGELSLDIETFDVRTLVERVVALMRPLAASKRLEIEHEIDPDVWASHMGDSAKIQQILTNLLNNAIKFCAEGSVLVAVNLIDENNFRQRLSFEVADTGIGIRPERLEQIFEPFTQADNTITRRYGGTGLGLAICRRLGELMKGDLSATSDPNVGSTFFLSLPLERGDEAAQKPGATPEPQSLPQKRILLIEDDEATRIIAATYLERLGHVVKAANGGQQALSIAMDFELDVVVTDVSLPDIEGPEVVKRLRLQLGDLNLPSVCMSAHVFPVDVERFLSQGMNAFVAKPLSMKSLALGLVTAFKTGNSIDEIALGKDMDAIGAEAVAELVKAASAAMPSRLDWLAHACANRDLATMRRVAHLMRSTAGTLNMQRLLEASRRVEDAAAGIPDDELVQLVAMCRQAWDDGLETILTQLERDRSSERHSEDEDR